MATRHFTTEQRRVIEHAGRHAVVSAVAGSGKTETLLGRLRFLLGETTADKIAVVMFNTDAAAGFRERFQKMAMGPAPEIRTFNSMGNKILNRLVQMGHLPSATVSDKDFQRRRLAKRALAEIFADLHGPDESPDEELIDEFVEFIHLVKSGIDHPQSVLEAGRYGQAANAFPEAFDRFEQIRTEASVRFFEDQLYEPVMAMLRNTELQRFVANRVDHLIVDEAQDMNRVQIELSKILAGSRAAVMIVGDEDQCIYEWRGAQPDFITRGFESAFPGAARYSLPHTFRYGHELALAASHLITRNANRSPKICVAAPDTPRTRIHTVASSATNPAFGQHIQHEIDQGRQPDEIAVLVRAYSLTVGLELELAAIGIPYYVYGRAPLIRIPEISALVGVLRLACGRWRSEGDENTPFILNSLLTVPPLYLQRDVMSKAITQAVANPAQLSEIIRSCITPSMRDFQADQIRDRADLLDIIANGTEPDAEPAGILDLYFKATKFESAIERQHAKADKAEAVLDNVRAFLALARKHEGNIASFLENIDPLIDSKSVRPPAKPHVWISTIHKAKGAEWPVVFVPGLVDKVFPRDGIPIEEVEGERRLCYVAMTRAKENLYLLHPEDEAFTKAIHDLAAKQTPDFGNLVSPFLWEAQLALSRHAAACLYDGTQPNDVEVHQEKIANEYFQSVPDAAHWRYKRLPRSHIARQASASPGGDLGWLSPGVLLSHPQFGPGVFENWVDKRVVKVRFGNDTRLLVVAMAGLTPR